MKVLFTRSPLIGSRFIRWGLDEPVSHVALEAGGIVLHSTWGDVDLDSVEYFLESREIVYEIDVPDYGLADLADMADSYEGSGYDFKGLICFGWFAFLRKFFNRPMPARNYCNTPRRFLCTEVATLLLYGKEDGIVTPYELYQQLREST